MFFLSFHLKDGRSGIHRLLRRNDKKGALTSFTLCDAYRIYSRILNCAHAQ